MTTHTKVYYHNYCIIIILLWLLYCIGINTLEMTVTLDSSDVRVQAVFHVAL